jgi:hypothetical protein
MLQEPIDPDSVTVEELCDRYVTGVRDAVAAVGAEVAVGETPVDADRVDALLEGRDGGELTVEEAARLLALADGDDADAVLAEVRDHLMLSMSTAVLDVDAIAANLDGELSAREIQAKMEGRLPMTLREYARIHHYVASQG